jgi:hypothetical protein
LKKRPLFIYTKGLFYKIWLSACALIMITAIANSVWVYIQVSKQLNHNIRWRLQWEARFYRQQLDEVFIRTTEKLNALIDSPAAISVNRTLLQDEMETIHNLSPSIVRSWVAYPNGTLIPSSRTRSDYVRHLPWWREYLLGETPGATNGLWVGRGQTLIGKPLITHADVMTLIPLFSFKLNGIKIMRAAGAELDLNSVLSDDTNASSNWAEVPVSIYTSDGTLVACPWRYQRGQWRAFSQISDHPLIRQMLSAPNEISGFGIYSHENQKKVGVYLRDPSLGFVLTIEYPTVEIIDPVSRTTTGSLMVTAFLLLIATIVLSTIYSSTKRLHRLEQLARSAEFHALQAHINPHFLFNTLDRMVGLATSAENLPLLKMLKSLANILRYTSRKTGELVSVQEELNYLREYINLQQVRFGTRFSFQLEAAPALLQYKLFKLSIQPIVENCFTHGVDKTLVPVAIGLTIRKRGHCLEICVSDNGSVISPERFQEINERLEQETYETDLLEHGLGLSNIHHRYRYAYGELYGIRLERLEQGLAVYLLVPLL